MRPLPGGPLSAHIEGVLAGQRAWLARAITLVESKLPEHQEAAQELLLALSPHAGRAHRVGITGVPGAGKSTFIDALGTHLTGLGHRVAVLAVDPSSTRSGGSILGDKTRMGRLAVDPRAFVRPSPSGGLLGGVARATREAMILVEAAGHDVVLVETVGVGQSEVSVSEMVDCFLVLMLARSGDGLQGIKKGLLELADLFAVNKAEAPHRQEAQRTQRELSEALHYLQPTTPGWAPPVMLCSALKEEGIAELWAQVLAHRAHLESKGLLAAKRQAQQLSWTWAMVEEGLRQAFRQQPGVQGLQGEVEAALAAGQLTATQAAQRLLAASGWARGPGCS